MREIKFRGKNKISGWHYGCYEHNRRPKSTLGIINQFDGDGRCYEHSVDKDSVGQFVGRLDRKCNGIYEYDYITKYDDDGYDNRSNPALCIVVYDSKSMRFYTRIILSKTKKLYRNMGYVIGNTTDNPELGQLKNYDEFLEWLKKHKEV